MALFSKIPVDKTQIENTIAELEKCTSAEVRVFIERKMPKAVKTAFERACEVFRQLEMEQTQHRNGVLIYLAYKEHQCYLLGDQGIHQFVGDHFWQATCDMMVSFFKQGEFTLGIVRGIEHIGKELSIHFPIQEHDVNELPNEVVING
ncbi:putative membrane protein [Cricetibacter osteomyelitidis]|uniref:Putative membrane protein n=1 Tax=Cricetibacter osteomyelitidis TaxID=1521931 RepID=A0A4R2T6E8_9PAST|nr:TPM domain-containing protein [Cricetibacter osteomyelitidis]TCP97685.1 putative membrane protein [Cricetibacter osteomyelitidis]